VITDLLAAIWPALATILLAIGMMVFAICHLLVLALICSAFAVALGAGCGVYLWLELR